VYLAALHSEPPGQLRTSSVQAKNYHVGGSTTWKLASHSLQLGVHNGLSDHPVTKRILQGLQLKQPQGAVTAKQQVGGTAKTCQKGPPSRLICLTFVLSLFPTEFSWFMVNPTSHRRCNHIVPTARALGRDPTPAPTGTGTCFKFVL
jgi:hypothetical protein